MERVRIIGKTNADGADLYDLYPWLAKRFPDGVICGKIYARDMERGDLVVQFDGTGHSNRFREEQIIREGGK